jgi:hypothetical protein
VTGRYALPDQLVRLDRTLVEISAQLCAEHGELGLIAVHGAVRKAATELADDMVLDGWPQAVAARARALLEARGP